MSDREITMSTSEPRQPQKAKDSLLIDPALVLNVIDWLTGDESHDLEAAPFVAELGHRLRAIGLPVDRLVVHLRTIHPEILGSTFAWAPNREIEIYERMHGIELTAEFVSLPFPQMRETREPIVVRLDDLNAAVWTRIDVLKDHELVEFIFFALRNARESVASVFFCTKRSNGFTQEERGALTRIIPALRNACELRTLRAIALSLLDTYVGTGTAQRIMAGDIQRGRVQSLDAALLLCDLRGFTQMSNHLPSQRVIELLDAYFDCIVPEIAVAGGEVLKYMGDAVLAFFHREDAAAACVAALEGALGALKKLEQFAAPDAELHAGIALHYGKVSYGNIGSGHRLDFTLIGPDVNLLARIQTVCSTTGQRVLMSKRFAELLGEARAKIVGSHDLKGFPHPIPLYRLAD
jgi:adenylate cyclase